MVSTRTTYAMASRRVTTQNTGQGGPIERGASRESAPDQPCGRASAKAVAYFAILVSWFTCAWVLLTFSMLIREMMGQEAEAELVASWATLLAVEMFGKKNMKLIFIRLFVDFVMSKAERKLHSEIP
ncbi:hypothetical protein CYMTET_50927 [Cymbomonas tetramitiformis]|uniref:Uncharacterized protein n=1 Tax=Cymbomonas tetramitiformis TaxID=36881 RepID=A0AAE0BP32_9CHLO|nr:hypothetical protein CYMTET_50927 [Cymbomonas tetramitiformis]